jgi:hypothetical protein
MALRKVANAGRSIGKLRDHGAAGANIFVVQG